MGLSIIVGVASCNNGETKKCFAKKRPKHYSATVYTPTIIKGTPYSFNGIIEAQDKHLLSFKVGGEIQFIRNENIPIKKGDLLASINNLELANNLAKIKYSLNDINEDLIKLYELQKDSIGPINTIKKLEVQKKIQESNYSSALYNSQKSVIVAPFDGFISNRLKKPGEFTQPTVPVVQYFSYDKKASFYVPEEIVSSLEIGQQVELNFKQDKACQAEITTIALSRSSNGLYKVKTSVTNLST